MQLADANRLLDPGYTALECKHCHEEMTYLAGFLPGLYAHEIAG